MHGTAEAIVWGKKSGGAARTHGADGGAQTRPTSRTTCCMPLQRVTQDRSGSATIGEKATVEVTGAGRPDGFDGDGHDDDARLRPLAS